MTAPETALLASLWYLAITLVGIAVFPLVYAVCPGLPDRGISLYRTAGVAVIPFPIWVAGNAFGIPFSALSVILTGLAIGIPAWIYALLRLDLFSFLQTHWRRLACLEVATGALFAGYVVFRGFNPDISGTEKPMELAFLNASIQSTVIPVEDPWFSGESINYYYFGYIALASISLVTMIPGAVAFNLALATTFALATVGAAGLAANLSALAPGATPLRSVLAGFFAGFLLMFSGNLHAAAEFVRDPSGTIGAGWWDGVGWSSSRVIQDSGFPNGGVRTVISEFPAFSWILGDLHPHVIAYPWLIASFALVANLYIAMQGRASAIGIAWVAAPVGLALAVLHSANTWDAPIVAAILAAAFTLLIITGTDFPRIAIAAGSVAMVSLATTLPFARLYASPTGTGDPDVGAPWPLFSGIQFVVATMGYVSWDRTSFLDLLTLYGGFLSLIFIILTINLVTVGVLDRSDRTVVIAGAGVLAGAAIALAAPAVLLLGVPALILITLGARASSSPGESIALSYAAVALLALVAVEFFFVRDPFGDRMNTVFKISFQAWAALSVAIGSLVPEVVARARSIGNEIASGVTVVAVIAVIVAVSVYSPISSYRWSGGLQDWSGINGTTYIDRNQPGDAAAIEWLLENTEAESVVLEAAGCAYGSDNFIPHNRVSMVTGIPTLIGWDGHQFQWRRGQPDRLAEIGARIEAARTIYEEPGAAGEIINRYGITHVFVGSHEIRGYSRCEHGPPFAVPDDELLVELGWELVFEGQGTRVYDVTMARRSN